MEYLASLNPYLATVIAAMIPVTEVNGAIPLAIGVYKMSPVLACLLGTVGTIIVVATVVPLLDRVTKYIRSWHPKLDSWIGHVFRLTHHRHTAEFERWGSLALLVFVAIPGPLTGVWSASLLAYLFGIKYRHALWYIGAGSLIASILVTLTTVGILTLVRV